MDIMCINDTFSPEQMAVIPNRPQKDKLYSIRDVVKSSMGTGLLLNEIENPHNGWAEMSGTKFTFEPNFNINRFANLNGDMLTYEMVKEVISVKA